MNVKLLLLCTLIALGGVAVTPTASADIHVCAPAAGCVAHVPFFCEWTPPGPAMCPIR